MSGRRSLVGGLAALVALASGCGSDPSAGSYSSDGLVFVRKVGSSNELFRARLSDGRVTAITQTPDRDERWPYWSDAANQLVYQRIDPGSAGTSDLLLWNPMDRATRALHATPRRDERWPAWSPDGQRIAYAFRGARPVAGINVDRLSDGEAQVLALTKRNQFFFRPSWSPDGSQLVAQRRGPDGTGSSLWILAPESKPRELVDDPSWFDMKPFFTRDGQVVVFSRRPIGGENRDICAVPTGGGEVRRFASQADADDHSARPSPTRDEIAFVSNRGGSFDAYVAKLDGSALRALTGWADRDAFAPRWSPDGERLVVTAQPVTTADPSRIDDAHIVVLDRHGVVLLDVPGAMPDWMPPWE